MFCPTLNTEFANKSDLFEALKSNEEKILSWKKSKVYKSYKKNQISDLNFQYKDNATKANIDFEDRYVYPVINTTKYLDSHDDVHFDNLFKKSIKEQFGKIDYVDTHSNKVSDLIVWRTDLEIFTKMVDWSMVGKDYDGQTQALIYKFLIENVRNETAKKVIIDKLNIQGSVAMQYVKIKLAVDSPEKKYAVNKDYFESKVDLIANKDKAIKQGYFFGVEEAKIIGEGSMVTRGSNDATEMIYPNFEPLKSTRNSNEPSSDTQIIDYKYLSTNFKL